LAANAGGLCPMLDEIRRHCALLLSEDFATHSAAYLWLREAKPFRHVLDRFREYDMNVFDVAALLAAGSSRSMADAAVRMLTEEIARHENGLRETVQL
jgi:hypothetical protein